MFVVTLLLLYNLIHADAGAVITGELVPAGAGGEGELVLHPALLLADTARHPPHPPTQRVVLARQ